MSDLLELARGLHKQAGEEKEGGKLAGTAAGLGTFVAGTKINLKGQGMLARSKGKGKLGAIVNGIGNAVQLGSIPVGIQVKRSLEKKAEEEKKKNALRPGVLAGLAAAGAGSGVLTKGTYMKARAASTTVLNNYRPHDVNRKNVKGFYENGKYVNGKTPGLQAKRIKDVAAKSNKLMAKGMKVRKIGAAAVLASPVVGALVGKAHRMMTEKKDK